ncbi:MAG: hypothetical protein N3D20_01050 [Candidatus Pacearchaeota archaeon]|nr:hypothetical protein [Candidatus Pacearchaeota archaeon]
MTKKTNQFEEFRKSYNSLMFAQEIGKRAYSDSSQERYRAREYALEEIAKLNPGLEAIIKDPIAREQIPSHIIDKYLETIIGNYESETIFKIKNFGKEIIRDAPDNGLASIIIGIEPCDIKNNEKHNKIAEIHKNLIEFYGVLNAYENDNKKAHGITYSLAMKEIAEKIKVIKDGKEKEKVERVGAVLLATIAVSERAGLVYLSSKIKGKEKEFNGMFKDEKEKAEYARATLEYWLGKGEINKVIEPLGRIEIKKK